MAHDRADTRTQQKPHRSRTTKPYRFRQNLLRTNSGPPLSGKKNRECHVIRAEFFQSTTFSYDGKGRLNDVGQGLRHRQDDGSPPENDGLLRSGSDSPRLHLSALLHKRSGTDDQTAVRPDSLRLDRRGQPRHRSRYKHGCKSPICRFRGRDGTPDLRVPAKGHRQAGGHSCPFLLALCLHDRGIGGRQQPAALRACTGAPAQRNEVQACPRTGLVRAAARCGPGVLSGLHQDSGEIARPDRARTERGAGEARAAAKSSKCGFSPSAPPRSFRTRALPRRTSIASATSPWRRRRRSSCSFWLWSSPPASTSPRSTATP